MRTLRLFLAAVAIGVVPLLVAGRLAPPPVPLPAPEVRLERPVRPLPRPTPSVRVLEVDDPRLLPAYWQATRDGFDPSAGREIRRVSSYNPVPSQTDADPGTSSCGPTLPEQLALSRDLFFVDGRKLRCGVEATLYVERGGGVVERYDLVVNDTTAARLHSTADLMVHDTPQESFRFGIRRGLLFLHEDSGI